MNSLKKLIFINFLIFNIFIISANADILTPGSPEFVEITDASKVFSLQSCGVSCQVYGNQVGVGASFELKANEEFIFNQPTRFTLRFPEPQDYPEYRDFKVKLDLVWQKENEDPRKRQISERMPVLVRRYIAPEGDNMQDGHKINHWFEWDVEMFPHRPYRQLEEGEVPSFPLPPLQVDEIFQSCQIEVTYLQDLVSLGKNLYRFFYLLQSGRVWLGKINQLGIMVNFPNDCRIEKTNWKLEDFWNKQTGMNRKPERQVFQNKFENIEPDKNLTIDFFIPPEALNTDKAKILP